MKWNEFCRISCISQNSVWLKPLWFNSTKLTDPVHRVLSMKLPSVKIIYWTSGSEEIIKIQLVLWPFLGQTHSPFYKMIVPAVWCSNISTSFCHVEQLRVPIPCAHVCYWHRKFPVTWGCGDPQNYICLCLHTWDFLWCFIHTSLESRHL